MSMRNFKDINEIKGNRWVYYCKDTNNRFYKRSDLTRSIDNYIIKPLCFYEYLIRDGIQFYDDGYIINKHTLEGKYVDSKERYIFYNYVLYLPYIKFFDAVEKYRMSDPRVRVSSSLEKYELIYGCAIKAKEKYNEHLIKNGIGNKKAWSNSSEFKQKSRMPQNLEFYLYRNDNNIEKAKIEHRKYLDRMFEVNSKKAKSMNMMKRDDPSKNNTRIEYYLKQNGNNYELAKEQLFNRQATVSLERYQERYGVKDGWKAWYRRQRKWQSTINSKPDEEILEINKKKYNGFIPKSTSEAANRVFKRLSREFPEYEFIYGGRGRELSLNRTPRNLYYYDCYIPEINLIIEYHGCKFHPKPMDYSFPNYRQVRAKDLDKRRVAIENGYNYIEIYDDLEYSVIIETLMTKIRELHRHETILEKFLY